jgi:sugar lactone lactonase YvrE
MTRVGYVRFGWGESLVCDERRQRLYFVDCQASTLHWLDDDDATLQRFRLPSMPTGIVPSDEGLLVGAVDDGLHVIDPDGATTRLVVSYPPELGGRCNDACADLAGNIVTGKLNLDRPLGSDANNLDGALLVIDGLDTHGRAEPRCTLDLRLV